MVETSGKTWVLGVETSCDETSVSVFDATSRRFLFEHTETQVFAHAPFGGVVPDIASRLHLDLLPETLKMLEQQLPGWVDRIALVGATTRPGLMTSLLVGAVFGKGLAQGLDVPFIAVDHCEAHMYSSLLPQDGSVITDMDQIRQLLPACALILSGGHSYWIWLDRDFHGRCIGATLDDAMGECFDKVSKMLGLSYPGGPEVERQSHCGNPVRFRFPVPKPAGLDFSFSGLKTAVRLAISRSSEDGDVDLPKHVCASFHQTIDRLVRKKVETCISQVGPASLWLSGGVSANARIRSEFEAVCQERDVIYRIVPRKYAGDNASMIAYLAYLKYKRKPESMISEEVVPFSIFSGHSEYCF